jgi:hypothetical protein
MSFGPPEDSPLNNRNYTQLNDALANLNKARKKIGLAQEAGIDCSQREAECDYLQDRIEKAKAVYFPHKP